MKSNSYAAPVAESEEASHGQRSYSSVARQEQLEQSSGHSQSSPADTQNTEQRVSKPQRLYLSPEQTTGSSSLTGSAGTASYKSITEKVIKDDTTGNGREYIRSSLESSVKDSLINRKGYTPQGGVAITASERSIARVNAVKGNGGAAAVTNFKPASVAGSNVLGGGKTGNLRYASKLVRETKAELLTGKEARLATLKRGGSSLAVAGIATMKTFGRAAGDLHGSDDLGVEAVRKTKDGIVATSRTLKVTSRAAKSIIQTKQKLKRSLRTMQKTAQKAKQAARYAATGITASFRTLSNPVVLKSLAIGGSIVAIIIVLMACISSISALFSSFTYSANDTDLTDAYAYVTELDTNLEKDLLDIPSDPKWSTIDVFNINAFVPETDPIPILSYLSVKYKDLKFKDVKGEIADIHAALYHLNYSSTSTGSGNQLDVTLEYTPFQSYVALNNAEMFPKTDDYSMYKTYIELLTNEFARFAGLHSIIVS